MCMFSLTLHSQKIYIFPDGLFFIDLFFIFLFFLIFVPSECSSILFWGSMSVCMSVQAGGLVIGWRKEGVTHPPTVCVQTSPRASVGMRTHSYQSRC